MILTKEDHENTKREIRLLTIKAGYYGRRQGFQLLGKAEELAKTLPPLEGLPILNSLAIVKGLLV